MTETNNEVPGVNEPDPDNVRMRSFQGGANGIGPTATRQMTYGDIRYEDGEGPAAGRKLPPNLGSGLSGLPEADAGNVEPLYNQPGGPPARGPLPAKD